jgi:murein DD-endopeptidase MepM/ murein hydrolase activator NlpD
MSRRRAIFVSACATCLCCRAADFSYTVPGQLVPGDSGDGVSDSTLYSPDMRFPIKATPAYANSQVYGIGGSQGVKGTQCAPANFSYPWHDNFCERRPSRQNLSCPHGSGHEGQDVRAASCTADIHVAVAAENGRITKKGPFWIGLLGSSGVYYSYLHMNPNKLSVHLGDQVVAGQPLGLVSDYMDRAHDTTVHLHFEIHVSLVGAGGLTGLRVVSPYMSLVRAYQRLLEQGGAY